MCIVVAPVAEISHIVHTDNSSTLLGDYESDDEHSYIQQPIPRIKKIKPIKPKPEKVERKVKPKKPKKRVTSTIRTRSKRRREILESDAEETDAVDETESKPDAKFVNIIAAGLDAVDDNDDNPVTPPPIAEPELPDLQTPPPPCTRKRIIPFAELEAGPNIDDDME